MPRDDVLLTGDALAARLRGLFRPDGHWNADAVNRLEPEVWQAWIAARLRGEDPYLRYARDEFPELAPEVFVQLANQERELHLNLAACRVGAGRFLAGLDSELERSPLLLKNAMELVGRLRARTPEALRTLRDWIDSEKLLRRPDSPMDLHRSALLALAAIQQRGNPEDQPLFERWLQPWKGASEGHEAVFLPAAFSGFALSSEHVPAGQLCGLLEQYREARQRERPFPLAAAVLALWIDRRDPEQVRDELWRAISPMEQGREHWETLRRIAGRSLYDLPPWAEMALLAYRPRASARALWGNEMNLRAAV